MAVFPIQLTRKPHQTGEPRGLLPSGGISAAKLHVPQMLLRPMGGRGVGSRGTIPCASHEAHRRMAVWTRQQTGSRARPASREALRRAAVKPRPSSMSPYAPARTARSPGSRGSAPCASHEARRRMAVFAMQLAGICTRPASRGTCRATAVKPQPTCMSLYAPARPLRAVRG